MNYVFKHKDFEIDLLNDKLSMKVNGQLKQIDDLTPIEFRIFKTLATKYNSCDHISREDLTNAVIGRKNVSRTIDSHICHLRDKIKPSNIRILNKRNVGYFLFKHEG